MATGTAGLRQKVAAIRELVDAAKRDAVFVREVQALVQDLPERAHEREVSRIVSWIQTHVRFVRDPAGVEMFTAPAVLLREAKRYQARGDCDDHVILASAMLEAIGLPTRYRVGGFGAQRWAHIWLQVLIPGRGWTSVELVKKPSPLGWETSNFPEVLTMGEILPSERFRALTLKRRAENRPDNLLPSQRFRAGVLRRSLGARRSGVLRRGHGFSMSALADLDPWGNDDGLGKLKLKKIGKSLTKLAKAPIKVPLKIAKSGVKLAKQVHKASVKIAKTPLRAFKKGKSGGGAANGADSSDAASVDSSPASGGPQVDTAPPQVQSSAGSAAMMAPAAGGGGYVPSYEGGGGGGGVMSRLTSFNEPGESGAQTDDRWLGLPKWAVLAGIGAAAYFLFLRRKR